MATLEPSVAVRTCEESLRQLMTFAYRNAYGPNWLEAISSPEQRQDWADRHKQEQAKRTTKGVAVVPNIGLAYCHMQELLGFVNKHWKPIEPAFGEYARQETKAMLIRFEGLRNTVMHSRELLLFEQELMSGIAGQIRNQVTIYMSTQDIRGDYYPRIESITDSFGNIFESDPQRADEIGSLTRTVRCKQILTPGQRVQFSCVGFDPQDRELEYILIWGVLQRRDIQRGVGGQPVTLTWDVQATDISPQSRIIIKMKTRKAKYHRHGSFDQDAYFQYTVRAPFEVG